MDWRKGWPLPNSSWLVGVGLKSARVLSQPLSSERGQAGFVMLR
jgi:hypothetical protein